MPSMRLGELVKTLRVESKVSQKSIRKEDINELA